MAASPSTKAHYKGVEYTFIATSEDVLEKLKCTLCTGLVYEPVQTSCDHLFCKSCSGKHKSCQKCRKKLTSSLDAGTKQAILNLMVKCPNCSKGCKWEGALADAEDHLEKRCQLQKVECPKGCGEEVERKSMSVHMKQNCNNRARKCVHEDEKGNPLKVTTAHLVRCGDFPLACPAGCGREMARKDMQKHLSTTCPEEYVSCKYTINGCDKVMKRKVSKEHESDDRYHFQILIQSQGVVFRALAQVFQSSTYTRPDVASLPLSFRPWLQNSPTCYPRPPWVVKLEGFEEKKRNGKHWRCEPVNSHFGGYRVSLRIDACTNNDGKGPYLSTYIALMKGDNDDNLTFPYRGRIAVSVLNQLEDKNHHSRLVWGPEFGISEVASQRVVEGERADCGWGMFNFIPHRELDHDEANNTLYLNDNSLFIRIDRFDPLL